MNLAKRPTSWSRPAIRVAVCAILTTGGLAMASAHPHGELALAATAHARLTDDAGGTALFPSVTGLSPGRDVTSCITVGAHGVPVGGNVVISATGVGGSLAGSLALSVDAGSGGGFGDCSGFSGSRIYTGSLAGLASVTGDGVSTGWFPAADPVRSFRFTVGLPTGTSATAMHQQAQADFEWRLVGPPPPGGDPDPVVPAPASPVRPSPVRPSPATPSPVEGSAPVTPSPARPSPVRPSPVEGSDPAVPVPSAAVGVPLPGAPGQDPAAPDPTRVDLQLKPSLGQRFASTAEALVDSPQFVAGPLLLALLFLLVQHLIDRRDPKLAHASRTRRELTLPFPTGYEPGPDR